jgi:hypothetical protein
MRTYHIVMKEWDKFKMHSDIWRCLLILLLNRMKVKFWIYQINHKPQQNKKLQNKDQDHQDTIYDIRYLNFVSYFIKHIYQEIP